MLPPVVQDVDEGVSHLARRSQEMRMESIPPHGPAAVERPIDGSRDANREAAHTTLEPRRCLRFHQQMEMIALNAEVKNAEPGRGRRSQCIPNCKEHVFRTQRHEPGGRP